MADKLRAAKRIVSFIGRLDRVLHRQATANPFEKELPHRSCFDDALTFKGLPGEDLGRAASNIDREDDAV